jgi:hypothetical protein
MMRNGELLLVFKTSFHIVFTCYSHQCHQAIPGEFHSLHGSRIFFKAKAGRWEMALHLLTDSDSDGFPGSVGGGFTTRLSVIPLVNGLWYVSRCFFLHKKIHWKYPGICK